jgi:tetraacyldisaccharide 4'-kinase
VAGALKGALLDAGAALYAAGWEARRRVYAAGLLAPRRVRARVVSVGNLTVGGTGKTTLTLHLARLALARGRDAAVVCRRYRPGSAGVGDEERLYAAALGEARVYAGRDKHTLARAAAAVGRSLVIVDDGFSHWRLERDLDVVLLDAQDLWGGGRLLPAGRLREPRRALERAGVVVVSRLAPGDEVAPRFEEVRRCAPAALLAAGRHRVVAVRGLEGCALPAAGPARVVTGTGNPRAVERTAREAGFEPVSLSAYRDHHWFSPGEARRELEQARAAEATLVLTAKDEVRWPAGARDGRVAVLEVAWEWVVGGEAVERMVLDGGERK